MKRSAHSWFSGMAGLRNATLIALSSRMSSSVPSGMYSMQVRPSNAASRKTGPCRVAVSPAGKIVVETVTSRSRRAASSRKNCR